MGAGQVPGIKGVTRKTGQKHLRRKQQPSKGGGVEKSWMSKLMSENKTSKGGDKASECFKTQETHTQYGRVGI